MGDQPDPEQAAAAAADLYGLPPEAFLAARTAHAAALRKAGRREAATVVGRLPRPALAAWLLNRLVRERPDVVQALLAVGAGLRRAQAELDAERLKELGAERRQRVADALEVAGELGRAGGHPPSAAVTEQVGATLTAAVLDPSAAAAVASGRLLRPMPADGPEGAPLERFVALPEAPPVLAPGAPTGQAGAAGKREDHVDTAARRDAERAVADAERMRDRARRAERDAQDALAEAQDRRERTEGRAADLRARIAQLRRRLDAAEDDLAAADDEVADRRASERSARGAAEHADDVLTRSRTHLESLR